MGRGTGKIGYYNLAPMDSHIHSLSAKGVRTQILSQRPIYNQDYTSVRGLNLSKKFITPSQVMTLRLEIKKDDRPSQDYETLDKTESHDEISISGDLKEKGALGRPRDSSWGQVLDNIESPTGELKEIVSLWKRYHLNDLHAGTKKQEDALKLKFPEGSNANKYVHDEQVQYLKSVGLYSDRGYEYGTGWLVEKVPSNVKKRLIELFTR